MKRLIFATSAALFLATSASAGGMSFSLPNLWFPSSDDDVVSTDCQSFDATAASCTGEK